MCIVAVGLIVRIVGSIRLLMHERWLLQTIYFVCLCVVLDLLLLACVSAVKCAFFTYRVCVCVGGGGIVDHQSERRNAVTLVTDG